MDSFTLTQTGLWDEEPNKKSAQNERQRDMGLSGSWGTPLLPSQKPQQMVMLRKGALAVMIGELGAALGGKYLHLKVKTALQSKFSCTSK